MERRITNGGGGSDVLRGSKGNDVITSIDGVRDVVAAGMDTDTCYVDKLDSVRYRETVEYGAMV